MFDFPYVYTGLAQLGIVMVAIFFMIRVGSTRKKLGVVSPATSGNETWECLSRVHMNTIEQMVLFVPLMWLAAVLGNDVWAGGAGALWIVGRLVYSHLYIKRPASRGPGVMMTFAALLTVLVIVGMDLVPQAF